MPASLSISVSLPSADPLFRILSSQVRDKAEFVKLWAADAAREARENCRAKPGRRWWRELARSIQVAQAGEREWTVSSAKAGANLQQFGGEVRPVRARALTIPIAEEARGKRAMEFERPGRPLFVPKGTNVLGYSRRTGRGKNAASVFVPLYALRASAQVPASPWFPSDRRLRALAVEAMRWLWNREHADWGRQV